MARAGADFLPFGHPGDDVLKPIWERMRSLSPDEGSRVVIAEIFAGVNAGAALPGLCTTMESWRPDVVVRESQEWAALVAAEKLGVPHARVSIIKQSVEARTFAIAAPVLERHRLSCGAPPDPHGARGASAPALTLFPPLLDELEEREVKNVFRFRSQPAAPAPTKPFLAWSEGDEPLVYISFGTVAGSMEQTRALYRAALDAVAAFPSARC